MPRDACAFPPDWDPRVHAVLVLLAWLDSQADAEQAEEGEKPKETIWPPGQEPPLRARWN